MITKRSSETIQKILRSRASTPRGNSNNSSNSNSYDNSRRITAATVSSSSGIHTHSGTAATMIQQQSMGERNHYNNSHHYRGHHHHHHQQQQQQQQQRTFVNSAPQTSLVSSFISSHPQLHNNKRSFFHTESLYHQKADDTLNTIQDTLEYYFEDNNHLISSCSGFEINFASGVLTVSLVPDHGTWVLNKQTPNKQIWWSSPVSGPRRYEFDDTVGKWVWTKYIDYCASSSGASTSSNESGGSGWTEDSTTLGEALKLEMIHLFQIQDGLEELDAL